MDKLTHINEQGRAKMVDVSNKDVTRRKAVACSSIQVNQLIYEAIKAGTVKKGDVLAVAQVAGIMAAKNTAQLIPMCHPLMLSGVDLAFHWDDETDYLLHIEATVKNKGETGVEMEALTAATTAALTVYDMCKALDKGMVIGPTYLLHKSGGKSGDYHRNEN